MVPDMDSINRSFKGTRDGYKFEAGGHFALDALEEAMHEYMNSP